jgi:hypothetical protein
MLFVLLFINYVCIFVSNLIGMKKNATVKIMLDLFAERLKNKHSYEYIYFISPH